MNKQIDIGLESAQLEIVDLSKELLVLRLAFGKLKAAVADAAAPIAAVLVPALQKAVFWAIRLVKNIGAVIGALLGVQLAQNAVTESVTATTRAVKRSLAGFDQLNRLEGSSGGDTTVQTQPAVRPDALTPELAAIVHRIMELLEPLRTIDFFLLRFSLARLAEAFGALAGQIGRAVEWVWYEILTPFAQWVMEKLAPMFSLTLKDAIEMVSAALTPLGEGFGYLWHAMEPVFAFIGTTVLTVLDDLRQLFDKLTATLTEKSEKISGIFQNIGQVITALWQVIGPILAELRFQWSQTFDALGQIAADILGFIIDGLYGVTEFLAGVFTGDWQRAWKGLGEILKANVNNVIGFLNFLLTGLTGALNGVIRVVNKLKFTAPDWVPGLGGKTFGFNLKTVTTPQIPYLARGAVLPANRPFLAMVGDQRHGTNIEAPLATIQEAVAVVMQDQLDALMAGFDATVNEIRQLHDTVSGIEVGDTVIGKAAQRYRQKMAVVYGRPY